MLCSMQMCVVRSAVFAGELSRRWRIARLRTARLRIDRRYGGGCRSSVAPRRGSATREHRTDTKSSYMYLEAFRRNLSEKIINSIGYKLNRSNFFWKYSIYLIITNNNNFLSTVERFVHIWKVNVIIFVFVRRKKSMSAFYLGYSYYI